jgi:hypothetical protein
MSRRKSSYFDAGREHLAFLSEFQNMGMPTRSRRAHEDEIWISMNAKRMFPGEIYFFEKLVYSESFPIQQNITWITLCDCFDCVYRYPSVLVLLIPNTYHYIKALFNTIDLYIWYSQRFLEFLITCMYHSISKHCFSELLALFTDVVQPL